MRFENNDGPVPELPRDEIDALLRAWHDESTDRARASRDEVLRRIGDSAQPRLVQTESEGPFARRRGDAWWSGGRRSMPMFRAAAVVMLAVIAGLALLIVPSRHASADAGIVQVPDGGRLDAVAPDGSLIGPCPLEHTEVDARISGFISRVTVSQRYRNTFSQKVEAVYTFPLSHRAAVDRMRMIVRHGGEERIVEGEVKERELARQIYESARRDGFVASLLEQQRPNIFTQSVANIEPGAEVIVEISYVESLQMRDGSFTFDFPMVVGPRYIPGRVPTSRESGGGLPPGLTARAGVILLAPAQIRMAALATVNRSIDEPWRASTAAEVLAAIERATPIAAPSDAWRRQSGGAPEEVSASFVARYPDGSEEPGTLRADGTGEIAGRWFWCPPPPKQDGSTSRRGTGYAQGTDQVPDAALITPMPVRPPERSGHDLSLKVSIETGGPAVTNLQSDQHRIAVSQASPDRAVIALEKGRTIPNRDFVLSWKLADGAMAEGVLTQVVPGRDGYFMAYLVPPARVEATTLRARELIFVLDTSGSMNGFPIEKSKAVMTRMLGAMRAGDTFNIITFAGDHHLLWPEPRAATPENLKLARDFVETRRSGGGTELMGAIDAALRPTRVQARVEDSAASAAGGDPAHADDLSGAIRAVAPLRLALFLTDGYIGNEGAIIDAVRRHAGSTRVFTFGIGSSVNRYLLAEMAKAGRGAADVILPGTDADDAVTLFSERVHTPVLTDVSMRFEGVETAFVAPSLDALPDLFDREPLVVVGRYSQPGRGTLTVRGMTGAGPWERRIAVDFPASEGNSTVVAPLWARAQVDEILRPHLNALQQDSVPMPVRQMVVRVAEEHRIMSPFTSFVAVEKTRVTVGGRPMLVAVPIELPQGVSWEGNFGSAGEVLERLRVRERTLTELPANAAEKDAADAELGFEVLRSTVPARVNIKEYVDKPAAGRSAGSGGTIDAPGRRLAFSKMDSGAVDATGATGATSATGEAGAANPTGAAVFHIQPATSAGAPPSSGQLPAVTPPLPQSTPPARRVQAPGSTPGDAKRGPAGSPVTTSAARRTEGPPMPPAAPAMKSADEQRSLMQESAEIGRSDANQRSGGFTANELNQLSAKLDATLLSLGIEALARREQATAAPAMSDPIRVVARFSKIDAELERSLQAMGIQIEARSASVGVLILRVPSDRLIDLGRLAATRRVEHFPETQKAGAPTGAGRAP